MQTRRRLVEVGNVVDPDLDGQTHVVTPDEPLEVHVVAAPSTS